MERCLDGHPFVNDYRLRSMCMEQLCVKFSEFVKFSGLDVP